VKRGGIPAGSYCPGCGGVSTGVHIDRALLPVCGATYGFAAPTSRIGMHRAVRARRRAQGSVLRQRWTGPETTYQRTAPAASQRSA
jgi:hypothetical protein